MKIRDRIKRLDRVKASELLPNPRNWRTHPQAQQDALRGVLAEVGWVDALLVRETPAGLQIVDGHMRAETTPDEDVPVLVLDLNDAEADKVLATFDPIAGMAESDPLKLDALLREIDTGSESLQQMLADLAEEAGLYQDEPKTDVDAEPQVDKAEELRKKWGVESGQLWLLGEHRLLCGDSTKTEDVERVMQGERAGICFTSPPYGQQREYTEESKDHISDWNALMQGVFQALPMDADGQVLVNLGLIHRDGEWIPYWDGWIEWMRSQGWRRFGWYVWDQMGGLPGDWNGRLGPSHEFVFHFNRQSVKPEKWVACDPRNTTIGERATAKRKAGGKVTSMRAKDGKVKDVSSTQRNAEKIPDSVIRVSRCATIDMARENHPATFPIQLASFAVQSWPGIAFEPFSGSGTSIIACEQLNRRCRAIEISPAYVAVALQRYQDATGKTPTLAK